MPDKTGNPLCITIFSAPNYCGSYGNKGAIFCSRPDSVDVLTFEESQNKPVVLQMERWDEPLQDYVVKEHVDGISYCMDKLIGYSTQVILGMLQVGSNRISEPGSNANEMGYLRKVVF